MAEKDGAEDSEKVMKNSSSDSEDESDEDLAVLELIDASTSSSSESEDEEEREKDNSKVRPNVKKTVSSDNNRPNVTDDRERSARIDRPLSELVEENTKVKRYHNTTGTFVTGIDVLSKESREKRSKRAERFGIAKEDQKNDSPAGIDDASGALLPPGSKIDGSAVRLEAINVTGVNDMSTKDIFDYFKDFMPSSIEWIDDASCNVVWLDYQSAARALVGMSQVKAPDPPSPDHSTGSPHPPPQASDEEPMEEDDEDVILDLISNKETGETERIPKSPPRSTSIPADAANTDSMQSRPDSEMSEQAMECLDMVEADMRPVEVKSKDIIRIGKSHPKADDLWMRFACQDDKKQKGAYKHSQYYLKYGNPNFGGYKGLVSMSKRKHFRDGKFQLSDSGRRKRRYEKHERWDEEDEQNMYPSKRKTRRSDDEEDDKPRSRTADLRDRLKKGAGRGRSSGSDGEDGVDEEDVPDEEAEKLDAELRHALGDTSSPKRKMYADEVEEKLKKLREESEGMGPLYKVRDARVDLNKRLSVRNRLGHIREAPTPASSLENLKIIVDTQDDISEKSSPSESEEEEEEGEVETEMKRSKVTGPLCQEGSDDLRGWLHDREKSRKLLSKLPSLKIEVQDDT